MILVACVRTGQKYGPEYVLKLRSMVKRHLPLPHMFVCFSDQTAIEDVWTVNISDRGLHGWWGKMALFDPRIRPGDRTLYFDLDTVILGDLTPLAEWGGTFAICANFIRLAGHRNWPCLFGSCVMSLAPGFGGHVWNEFNSKRQHYLKTCPKGDQQAIEAICPNAALLQKVMPPNYFIHYRQLGPKPPKDSAIVCFGGKSKPANSRLEWVREAWN